MDLRGGGIRAITAGAIVLALAGILLTLAVWGIVALLSSPAGAQARCGDRAMVVAMLAERHGERQAGAGLTTEGMMEIWAAPDSGTWTAILTLPSGISCLVAAGTGWTPGPDLPDGEAM